MATRSAARRHHRSRALPRTQTHTRVHTRSSACTSQPCPHVTPCAGGYVGYAVTTRWGGADTGKLQMIGFDMGGTSTGAPGPALPPSPSPVYGCRRAACWLQIGGALSLGEQHASCQHRRCWAAGLLAYVTHSPACCNLCAIPCHWQLIAPAPPCQHRRPLQMYPATPASTSTCLRAPQQA